MNNFDTSKAISPICIKEEPLCVENGILVANKVQPNAQTDKNSFLGIDQIPDDILKDASMVEVSQLHLHHSIKFISESEMHNLMKSKRSHGQSLKVHSDGKQELTL